MKLHQALAKYLADSGSGPLFGLIGDANLYFADSFSREFNGQYVSFAHEVGAILAALGYSKVTGRTGVATVTHGPGFANTFTGLVEGVRSRTPSVLIAGDTARSDAEHLQRLEQREVARAAGAGFVELRGPETWLENVRTAFRLARTQSRPIVLNVPADLMAAEVEPWEFEPVGVPKTAMAPHPDEVESAAAALSVARRPLVLAGRGAGASPGAREALLRLADRIGAPVATTLGGKGLFRGEPHNLGIIGTLISESSSEALAASDCIISFGASLNRFTTAEGSLLEGKTVIVCDHEASNLRLGNRATVFLVGDASLAADALIEAVDVLELPSTGFRDAISVEPLPPAMPSEALDIRGVLDLLNTALPEDRVLVTDVGRTITHSWQRLDVTHPRRAVHTANFGSIGLGMAHAIGAAVAEPDALVLNVVGDGGFMLGGLTEFNTAVRHGLRILTVVLNDQSYGAEYIQFEKRGMDPEISTFEWPDLGAVATSLGASGRTVRTWQELRDGLAGALESDGPVLLNVMLNARTVPSLR